MKLSELVPGDLVFLSGIYFPHKKLKAQKHDMVHVEIFTGGETGEETIGARWGKGTVKRFETFKFVSQNYHSIKYYYKSIDSWLDGVCKSYCPEHEWNLSATNNSSRNKNSIFSLQDQVYEAEMEVFEPITFFQQKRSALLRNLLKVRPNPFVSVLPHDHTFFGEKSLKSDDSLMFINDLKFDSKSDSNFSQFVFNILNFYIPSIKVANEAMMNQEIEENGEIKEQEYKENERPKRLISLNWDKQKLRQFVLKIIESRFEKCENTDFDEILEEGIVLSNSNHDLFFKTFKTSITEKYENQKTSLSPQRLSLGTSQLSLKSNASANNSDKIIVQEMTEIWNDETKQSKYKLSICSNLKNTFSKFKKNISKSDVCINLYGRSVSETNLFEIYVFSILSNDL